MVYRDDVPRRPHASATELERMSLRWSRARAWRLGES